MIIVVVLILLAGFAYLILVTHKTRLVAWRRANTAWLDKLWQKVVVFLIFTQIVVSLKMNHTSVSGTPMAEPYAS